LCGSRGRRRGHPVRTRDGVDPAASLTCSPVSFGGVF
jgi:hypothetical protein